MKLASIQNSSKNVIKTHKISCNLCGNSESFFLFNAKDRLYGLEGIFSYVKCKVCGLIYMNPQVSTDDIGKFYPLDYVPHCLTQKVQDCNSLKFKVKKIPFIDPFLRIRKQFFQFLKSKKIESTIYRKLGSKSRILDVGCGNGTFLDGIKSDIGCQVFGVDFSENAVRTAKELYDINIYRGNITEPQFPNNYFDIITAWWYLEHINNPSKAVAKFYELLKDKGCCIIGVPNFDSVNARIFKDKWYHLDCPRHLYIYTPKTIKWLLQKNGFSIVKILYDKTPGGLLGSLQYFFYKNNVNPKYCNRIKRSAFLMYLFLPWTLLAASLRLSDIIIVYAKKS